MPSRRKVAKVTPAERTTSEPSPSVGEMNDSSEHSIADANDRGSSAPRGSLKEFIEQYKDKHYHAIEMRIVLVCSFGVFVKLFFSSVLTEIDDPVLTYSTLSFIALCILVIIFNTWLDYFPSRLQDTQPRESRGQGIPMACLLVPMVCCAQLYFSLYFAKHLAGLLQIYLVILCLFGFLTVLATLLHSIPHPNHIIFYNFSIVAISYIIEMTVGVSMWMLILAAAMYSLLGAWLLNSYPRSFTMGEAIIVAQGLSVLFMDTAVQLLSMYELIHLPKSLQFLRTESVLYIELLIVGVAVCYVFLNPALYKLSRARYYHEKKFWSGTFILLSLSIGFMLILPWLGQLLGGHNPIAYVIYYSFSSPIRLLLMLFWMMVTTSSAILIYAQSSTSHWTKYLKPTETKSSLLIRKAFHVSASFVFLTGLALDPNFISLAASLVTFLIVVAELGRVFKMWPFGEYLHGMFVPLLGKSDTGDVVVSHLYLFLGFSLPLWLFPLREYKRVSKLAMYSGVLALGIGDAMASIVGKRYGKVNWPGTKKTIEGSFASILAQLGGVFIIILIDPHLEFLSPSQWGIVMGTIAITASLEAYTWQIDNLILGIFQYAITITFLN